MSDLEFIEILECELFKDNVAGGGIKKSADIGYFHNFSALTQILGMGGKLYYMTILK